MSAMRHPCVAPDSGGARASVEVEPVECHLSFGIRENLGQHVVVVPILVVVVQPESKQVAGISVVNNLVLGGSRSCASHLNIVIVGEFRKHCSPPVQLLRQGRSTIHSACLPLNLVPSRYVLGNTP